MIQLFLLLILWPAKSMACGQLSLSFTTLDLNWSTTSPTIKKYFEVRRSPPFTPCTYFVAFSKGQGPSFEDRQAKSSGFGLSYQVYSSPNNNSVYVLKDLDNTRNPSNFIMGAFDSSPNTVNRHEIYVQMKFTGGADPLLPRPGLYTDSLTAKIYTGSPAAPDAAPKNIAILPVSLFINRVADISIGPPGVLYQGGHRSERVDFGILRKGATRSVDLRVVTNSGYKIYLSSENNGALAHERKEIKSVVPYEMRVNSVPIPLENSKNAPVLAAEGHGASRTSGIRNDVRITILDSEHKMAGNYRDVVTFEVRGAW